MLKIVVDLVPGELYQFAGLRGPNNPETGKHTWKAHPGVYRCVGLFARPHADLEQKMVGYVGVSKHDEGNAYIVTLEEWQRLFTRIKENGQQEQPATPVTEPTRKIAGYRGESNGY